MSAYVSRYCKTHGEWDTDVDNPGDCPECPDERDALRARVAQLEAALRDAAKCYACAGVGRNIMAYSARRRELPCEQCSGSGVTEQARAALAASPDAAGRRWEAMREVCEAAMAIRPLVDANALRVTCNHGECPRCRLAAACDALARLDAEGRRG